MRLYFAPMEGITTYIYRNLHHEYYKGVDKYFTPFVSPTMHGCFTPREKKDVIPNNNKNIPIVPQILTNRVDYFLDTAKQLYEYGYDEVNLNLGCPSNTVVSKCKGSGFLSETYALEKFLDGIFSGTEKKISIKTRIGRYGEEEFKELLTIFNHYPIEELIIHPRVQQDYYKNPIHMHVFLEAMEKSKNPVCYNGEINTIEDYENLKKSCPNLQAIMIGRGAVGNPAIFSEILTGEGFEKKIFKEFHEQLYETYVEALGNNALYKMKELWIYMGRLFPDGDSYLKKIKKSQKNKDYEKWVQQLLEF
ncbi:MAG: tRNA-dihydrouridine synthase family protein [Lachnospiraceae bacterium]|nr:tRNA-dihydrouridine synthase family protein [Lachnospiraceae bacterium]